MPSSDELDSLHEVIRRLMGRSAITLRRLGGGGNNRLYEADLGVERVAIKIYFRHPSDTRDRLAAEFAALEFLAPRFDRVPRAIAQDHGAGIAIYSWLDGVAPGERRRSDITAMAGFAATLHGLRGEPSAAGLPLASESCLSARDLPTQLERRLAHLTDRAAPHHSGLDVFLRTDLAPAITRVVRAAEEAYDRAGWDWAADLAPGLRTLSPSDFGTHNALRQSDGGLAFLDFEYFGWDDPVKLTADVLLHPGMRLEEDEQRLYLRTVLPVYGEDGGFGPRLGALFALYALRWSLIALNAFLPERWERHKFATGAERDVVLAAQLEKAKGLYARADTAYLAALLAEAGLR